MTTLHYSKPVGHNCSLAALLSKTNKPKQLLARPSFLAMIAKDTPPLAAKIATWLRSEGKRIAAELASQANKVDLGVLLRKAKPKTLDEALEDIDLGDWDALAGIITDDTYDTYRKAYDDGLTVTGLTDIATTKQVDDKAQAYARNRAAEMVGKAYDEDGSLIDNPDAKWAITESTRSMLRSTISSAVDNGDSPAGLKAAIESSAAFSDTRASTIARTELANAHIQGNLNGWTDAGVAGKRSVLGSAHDIDDVCDDAADDGIIDIDGTFSNGFDAPPYHPNCVCDILPILSSEMKQMLKGDVAGHEFHGNQWGDVSGGEKLSTSDKARLAALHVPPAWTDVRLNKDPSAGLQAIGKDSKGRSQYLYSAAHSEAAAAEKWARISDFHKVEPGLTKQAFKDMNNTNLSQKERDTAATVALVSQTGFRIGSDRDTGADVKAFGASNLLGSQVEVNGNKVSFNFTGKKGVGQEHSINNADLAKYIKGRQAKVGDGRLFHSSAGGDAANAYIHSATGGKDFSIKDYRTHIATSTALDAVNKMSAPRTNAEYKTSRNAVGDIVAKQLGNTRGMALNSYIHPAAFSGWGFRK